MRIIIRTSVILLFIILFQKIETIGQGLMEEKSYKLAWSSHFLNGIKLGQDIYLAAGCLDSTSSSEFDYVYTRLVKIDNDKSVEWDIECQRHSTNSLLYLNTDNQIVTVNDFFKARAGFFIGDFYPFLIKTDFEGNVMLANLDTTSLQSKRINSNGRFHQYFDDSFINVVDFFNPIDSTLGLMVKYFDADANFIKEESLSLFRRNDLWFRLEVRSIVWKPDYTFSIIAKVYNKDINNDSSYILVVNLDNNNIARSYTFLGKYQNLNIIDTELINQDSLIILIKTSNPLNKSYLNGLVFYEFVNRQSNSLFFHEFTDLHVSKITKSKNNAFYICGVKRELNENMNSYSLIKLDNNYTIDWYFDWGRSNEDKGNNGIVIEEENGLITIYGSKRHEAYLAYISIPTSVNEFKDSRTLLSISPNPATDYIVVDILPLERGLVGVTPVVKLFNVLGVEVMTASIHPTTQSHRMNIESLPPGVYFVQIGSRVQRFVKI